eukprot:TRINITY_DN2395_c0_g1_i7.p2 TRINITY_DN2395_c0_g1~~TRINITY_DN2395_c0_g1_i7.p2  ORF type:complete len:226 (+),score=28.97 TRINITY_DN2395_c0_g1_i7:226-903(+)
MAVHELADAGGRVTLERLAAAAERAAAARLRIGRGRGGPPMVRFGKWSRCHPARTACGWAQTGCLSALSAEGVREERALAEAAAAAAAAAANGGEDASAGIGVGGMSTPGVVDGRVAKLVATSRGNRSAVVTLARKGRAGKGLASDAAGSLHMAGLPPPPPPPPALLPPGSSATYHSTPPPALGRGARVAVSARRPVAGCRSTAGASPVPHPAPRAALWRRSPES